MKIKTFLSFLLIACMIFACIPQVLADEAVPAVHFYGDVNFDDTVNTADATLLLKYGASMIMFTADRELAVTSEGYMKADANKDLLVNTADASFILRVAANMANPNTYTDAVTPDPTAEPTAEPTTDPTAEPTTDPTSEPTSEPSAEPTAEPTSEPTSEPTPVQDYIEIATKEDFLKIGVESGYGLNKKYKQTADIDLGGEILTPIGYINNQWYSFTGKYDGDGHKLCNFNFRSDIGAGGLFLDNQGVIQNVYADASPCTVTARCTGIICYENTVSGRIINCGTSGKMVCTNSNSWLGGITSWNEAYIDQCWTNVEIEACTEMIDNSMGYVDAGYSGMIAAGNHNGSITNCITFGSIRGSFIGMIFGQNSGGEGTGNVMNCYSLSKMDFYHPDSYANAIGFVPLVGYVMYYPNAAGFFYLKGMMYCEGNPYTSRDNNQYTNSYYGCALAADGFTQSNMSMYDAGVWDFSGQYPVLRNAAGITEVEVKPYGG